MLSILAIRLLLNNRPKKTYLLTNITKIVKKEMLIYRLLYLKMSNDFEMTLLTLALL